MTDICEYKIVAMQYHNFVSTGRYLILILFCYWNFCGFCRTTPRLDYIRKMTRLRVVDNSAIGRAAELAGKPARCIHVYNKTSFGYLGDKVRPDSPDLLL